MVGGFVWERFVSRTLLSALRASHFLLLRQKKVSKEKATPGCAVGFADFPALLETGGGCGTRATPSNSPRPFSAGFSVARRSTRGPKGGARPTTSKTFACYGRPEKKAKTTYPSSTTDALPCPLSGAEQRRWAGRFRLALFEPQASSGKPPGPPSSARNPAGAPTQGSPFLWLLSFGEAKESTPASKAETQANCIPKANSSNTNTTHP